MKFQRDRKRGERGAALAVALFFIVVSTAILLSMSSRSIAQRLVVDRFDDYYLAITGAEAAQNLCILDVEGGGTGILGLDNWEPEFCPYGTLLLPDFDAPGVVPVVLDSMPDVELIGYTYHWFGDGRDANGDGTADSAGEFGAFSIHTAARINGQTRYIECIYSSESVNVWNNAIFADSGQTGRLINGNVSIHGSVHLLGDPSQTGAVAVAAVAISGSALITNDYLGMPANLFGRLEPLPVTRYNGEDVATLSANLRVKQGLVGLSGSARIGRPWEPSTKSKGPVDGTYVNEGWTGNSLIDDSGRGIPDPGVFFSDNGHEEGYDLGDKVAMPYLNQDWREPDGSRIEDPNSGSSYAFEDYFTKELLLSSDDASKGQLNGSLVLDVRSEAVNARYWNASTGQYLTGAAALAAIPAAEDSYLKFDPISNVLLINGQIRINGSLTFRGQGGQDTIYYSGRAAVLVTGDVIIDTNLLTCNDGNPADMERSFPINNALGLMAKGNIVAGSTSQKSMMGAFYTQNTFATEKQSHIVGAVVANYFSMGTNVPSIYQVPTLAGNLPYGMIGNYPIMVLKQQAWRELGIETTE